MVEYFRFLVLGASYFSDLFPVISRGTPKLFIAHVSHTFYVS